MFKILDEVCTPTRGSKYSACVDLYAREDVTIGAGETVKVPLGVRVDLENNVHYIQNYLEKQYCIEDVIDEGYYFHKFLQAHYLELHPRSSLRAKGLISNTGIIDLDYKDEIKIIIHNPIDNHINSDLARGRLSEYNIKKGDKIAKIMLMEHKSYLFGIETKDERTGGFGSTGG